MDINKFCVQIYYFNYLQKSNEYKYQPNFGIIKKYPQTQMNSV